MITNFKKEEIIIYILSFINDESKFMQNSTLEMALME